VSVEKRFWFQEDSGSTNIHVVLLPGVVAGLGTNGSKSSEKKRELFIVFISEICAIQVLR